MFGFYDPKSLKIDRSNRTAQIDFIDVADAKNIRHIEIKTAKKAYEIAEAMRHQATAKISCLEGPVIEARGSIVFSDSHPDEGLLEIEGGRTIPLKTNFFVAKGQLPRIGNAVVRGVEVDGAFVAHMLVVKPAMPGFEPRPSVFDRGAH